MGVRINLRISHQEKYTDCSLSCATDFEVFLGDYCPSTHYISSSNCPCGFPPNDAFIEYSVKTEEFKDMLDSLDKLTDEQFMEKYQGRLDDWDLDSLEEASEVRAMLVEDFKYFYENRDMDFWDGDWMFFSYY